MTIFVMLDLETWGKRPGADIRSIGACVFDPETGVFDTRGGVTADQHFYIACDNPLLDREDAEARNLRFYPLTRDPDTVQWWSEQSDEAQAAFADPVDLRDALLRFSQWIASVRPDNSYAIGAMPSDDLRLWAHGPQFDISILEAAYHAVGLPVPWHYRAPRDTRTILEAAGIDPHKGLEMFVQPGDVYHHALSDAVVQARAVCAAYKVLRSKPHNGFDHIANFINALDTEGMTPIEVRSAVYKECMRCDAVPAKQSSPELSTLAARVLHLGATGTPEYNALLLTAKRLAGSVLSQDETPVEAVALAMAIEFYGPNFDPFTNPEAFDFMEKLATVAIAAIPTPPPADHTDLIARKAYRHKKRGTTYEVIGEAELQASQPQAEYAALVIYRGEDGKLWARNSGEFHDGRFEEVAASTAHKHDH